MSDHAREVYLDSPLMEPWTYNSAHKIANDWELFTKTVPMKGSEYGPCGYQAELGYTRYSGDFMVKQLKQANWIDANTTLLFFEQTFLNIPIDSFVLLRIREVYN